MRLENKVALITGGTSGIGKATVARFRREGAKVVFTGRNQEAGEAVAAEQGAMFVEHDVTDTGGYEQLESLIRSDFGQLDIAFANAGTSFGDTNIEEVEYEKWLSLLDINLTGSMLTTQLAIRIMRDNPGGPDGSIVINSSMNGHFPLGNYVTYSTSKGAQIALAKSTALHCASQGYRIRCNSIHPGVVETELITSIIEAAPDPAAARAQFNAMAPLNRMATVDEVAGLVVYLGSDDAGFVTGAAYNIDGATSSGMMGV
ncbi:MAG: SDR family oxidoreductase [Burkholderiales bacterium]|nr:SDR family oxidoreductase [Burkholderiales bacterium]